MHTQKKRQIGAAILLLLIFAISSATVVLDVWAVIAVSTPLVTAAVIIAFLSLYGFYMSISDFIESNQSGRNPARR
jgi:hypothetical protein